MSDQPDFPENIHQLLRNRHDIRRNSIQRRNQDGKTFFIMQLDEEENFVVIQYRTIDAVNHIHGITIHYPVSRELLERLDQLVFLNNGITTTIRTDNLLHLDYLFTVINGWRETFHNLS